MRPIYESESLLIDVVYFLYLSVFEKWLQWRSTKHKMVHDLIVFYFIEYINEIQFLKNTYVIQNDKM